MSVTPTEIEKKIPVATAAKAATQSTTDN